MKVKDIMTENVYTVNKNDSVFSIAKIMKNYDIGIVPVVDDNKKILGLVTDRDIVLNMSDENVLFKNTKAYDIMSSPVYSIKPNDEISSALNIMRKEQLRRLPVIENNVLYGMLSFGDIASSTDFGLEISDTISEISMPSKTH